MQVLLRIPRNSLLRAVPTALLLVNVFTDALRSYAQADRQARAPDSVRIAHFASEFECPHERLFNSVLLIGLPQPAEEPKSAPAQPLVQLRCCRLIKGAWIASRFSAMNCFLALYRFRILRCCREGPSGHGAGGLWSSNLSKVAARKLLRLLFGYWFEYKFTPFGFSAEMQRVRHRWIYASRMRLLC